MGEGREGIPSFSTGGGEKRGWAKISFSEENTCQVFQAFRERADTIKNLSTEAGGGRKVRCTT